MSKNVDVFDAACEIASLVETRGKQFAGDGTTAWPFAYGYLTAELSNVLLKLDLTKKQQAVLEEYVQQLSNRIEKSA